MSALRRDLRHGARIGRAEFRRSLRSYTRDARRIVGLLLAVVFLGGNLVVSLPAVYLLGRTARGVAAIPYFEPAATLLPVGLLLLAAARTMERVGGADAADLLLTTVHPRAVVIGLLAAEVARLAVWFGLPVVAGAAAFALGLGAPLLPLTVGLVALPLVGCTVVWGYALGLAGLRVLRRLPTLRRLLKVGGALAFVALVVGSQVAARSFAAGDVSLAGLRSLLAVGPLADYAALAFVGTPLAGPVTPGAAAVLLGLLTATPAGLAVAVWQARALWFGDASAGADGRATAARGATDAARPATGFSPPRPFAFTRAGRIAWALLVRSVRHPQQRAHLLVLVFFAGPLGGTLLDGPPGDGFAPLLAGAGVVLGVYVAGAAFGLNPLGEDRPQLPLLLLTGTAERTVLRGRLIAGLAVGLPVATLVPLGAVALGLAPRIGAAFALVGAALSLAAAAFAVGVGCGYPIYEERQLWGAETVAPSTLVLIGYSTVVTVGTVVALVLTWVGLNGRVGPVVLALASVYLLPTVCLPVLSARYAVRQYRRYEVT